LSEYLYAGIENLPPNSNISPTDYINEVIRQEQNKNLTDFNIIETVKTSFAGNIPAHKIVYTYTVDEMNYKELVLVSINNDKVYFFSYHAEPSRYSDFLPTIQNIIESFKVEPMALNVSLIENETPGFLTYHNATHGINIQYPSSWKITEDYTINLFAPHEDGTTQYRVYEFAIDIESVYDLNTDYFIKYTWEGGNQT
jgi:hypothetical protein